MTQTISARREIDGNREQVCNDCGRRFGVKRTVTYENAGDGRTLAHEIDPLNPLCPDCIRRRQGQ